MAIYKVKDPTGTIRQIQGPDGASDEEVIAQAQKLFANEQPQQAKQPSLIEKISNFAGTTGLGKGIAQVINTKLYGKQIEQAQNRGVASNNAIQAQIEKLRKENPVGTRSQEVKDKITKLLAQQNNPYKQNNLEQIATGGEGYQTTGQVMGSALQTGANILSAGQYGKVAKGGKLAQFLARTGINAGTSGLASTGQALQEGKTTKEALISGVKGAGTGAAFSAGMEGVGQIAKGAGWATRSLLGKTTGAGEQAILEAATNPSKDLIGAMRGKDTAMDVVTTAQDAVASIKNERNGQFRDALGSLRTKKQLNTEKPFKALVDGLNKFGVSVTQDETGKFIPEFKNLSRISRAGDKAQIERIIGAFSELPQNPTPQDIFDLKLVVNDALEAAGIEKTSAFKSLMMGLKNSIDEELSKVSGYKKMNADYARSSALLDDLKAAFSLKPGINFNKQAAASKLQTALRDNQTFRQEMLQALTNAGAGNIKGRLSGAALSDIAPRGIAGALTGGAGGTLGAGLISGGPLGAAAGFAAASPRIIGEAAVKYGQASAIGRKIVPKGLRDVLKRQAAMRIGQIVSK